MGMLAPTKRNQLPEIKTDTVVNFTSEIDIRALEHWNPSLRAYSDADNTISIFDPIGGGYDGVTAKRIAAALRTIGDKDVVVNINSPGGDVFEGIAIYSLLKAHKKKVTVNILGLAASIASIIAMAGDEVNVSDAGFIMIHNAWAMAVGNRHDMYKMAQDLEPIDRALASVYSARTGMTTEEIAALMDSETWFTAQDTVEKGFSDALISSEKIKTVADESKTLYGVRKVDALLAKAGVPRSERRNLINEIKGTHEAAVDTNITHDADEIKLIKNLINTIKGVNRHGTTNIKRID